MAAVVLTFTACNSNDHNGVQDIEIPGVTLDGDVDCCSAEEALQVYKFLQTVTIIPELSIKDIDDKYNVFAYRSADFHKGYNEIFFVATKKKNGNYVKDFDITSITPLMHMSAMNMYHSTPVSAGIETFDNKHPENDYLVTLDCPEFTSLCPKTGQPDFGHIIISYIWSSR